MTKYSGKGTIKFDNGDVYVGEYKDSLPHGRGKMTYNDGRIVDGLWHNGEIKYEGKVNYNGLPHGKGKRKYSNGTYEGEWLNGKKHGKGTLKCDGGSYEGDWKHDKRHGEGSGEWSDGESYEGEWKEGKRHGKGTCKWPNGASYEGEWKDGKKNGRGVMTFANLKAIYDGEWKEDLTNGEGIIKYGNGDVYKGGFKNNKKHGKGVFEYAEGDLLTSTGEWKDGKRCGEFENVPRAKPVKVYYNENGEVESEVRVKREAAYDEDTDTEDFPPSKRRNVSF